MKKLEEMAAMTVNLIIGAGMIANGIQSEDPFKHVVAVDAVAPAAVDMCNMRYVVSEVSCRNHPV